MIRMGKERVIAAPMVILVSFTYKNPVSEKAPSYHALCMGKINTLLAIGKQTLIQAFCLLLVF